MEFDIPRRPEVPADGECALWWARPGDAHRGLDDLLNPDERTRADAYVQDVDRRRFTVGVAITRMLASAYLNVRPPEVPLDRSCDDCGRPHGRPRLPDGRLGFSVSHSGDWIVVAATTVAPVGVDVEAARIRGEPPVRLALAESERAHLDRLPPNRREHGFLRYWVRKEAVLKATGDGLRVPMPEVVVSGCDEPAALVSYGPRPDLSAVLTDVDAPTAHIAALALCTTSTIQVRHRDAAEALAAVLWGGPCAARVFTVHALGAARDVDRLRELAKKRQNLTIN